MRFTCPPGTAWEESVKTCVGIEQVEACQRVKQQRKIGNDLLFFVSQQRKYLKIDTTNDSLIYEADENALNGIPVARTLAEARALGPIVTPKQYQCSFCNTGACGIVVYTIQCVCGAIQCQPTTTTTTTSMSIYVSSNNFFCDHFSSTTKSLCTKSM
jgi:hypothetical protein